MTEPTLVVRRLIRASPARLFTAWTTPAQLVAWWGPAGVRCSHAAVEAHVGGAYRIDNTLPDGRVVVIAGEFLRVDAPTELVYTWSVDESAPEQVQVRFEARETGTEVIVTHTRIVDEVARAAHELGWIGCLDGLQGHMTP